MIKSLLQLLGIGRHAGSASQVDSKGESAGQPFELHTVAGAKAVSALLRFRKEPGVVPVIFGDSSDYDNVRECMGFNEAGFDEYLQLAASIDIDSWIAGRLAEDPEQYQEADLPDSGLPLPAGAAQFTIPFDILSGKPKPKVLIGMLRVEQPWHVPAVLRMGSWNDCPPPEVHVAFFRHWYERYGAVVAGVSRDVVEFTVERPPATLEEARALAHEQYVYCTDIVSQGVGSEATLARTLLNARSWYFWWD